MRKKYRPTKDDKELAVNIIKDLLDFGKDPYQGAKMLRIFLDNLIKGCIDTYTALKNKENISAELDDEKIPNLLVDLLDIELLQHRKIREILLDQVFLKDKNRLRDLERKKTDSPEWNDFKAEEVLSRLKKESWNPGTNRARNFTQFFGFPMIFAGIPSPHRPEYVEAIEPRHRFEKLKPFQENIRNQMIQLLRNRDGMKNRGIIRLPTGSGKTRIAAEAVLDFWKERNEDIQFVLWVAQYNELCEQALSCFRQLWEEKGEDDDVLHLFRVYGGRNLPRSDDEGIMIAGIDQLDEFVPSNGNGENDDRLKFLRDQIGVVIVDEAHRSVSTMYKRIFESLGIKTKPESSEQIPLIGLTATPYRSNDIQTQQLLKTYNEKILYPNPDFPPKNGFDDRWNDWKFLKKELTKDKILSKADYHFLETDSSFDMDSSETDYLESKNRFSPHLLGKVGIDKIRNRDVFNEILKWAKDERNILFFGASLNQAILISKLLNEVNIESGAITGETNYGARLNYVKLFREKKIQVLCNYEVLTTGFDAPKVDTLIIARPTSSRGLYEQMVGRGLRGPEFGGTETCDIITVKDNIYKYGKERVRLGSEDYFADIGTLSVQSQAQKLQYITGPVSFPTSQPTLTIPQKGEVFTEKELSKRFGVQIQGGIRYNKKSNIIILIDSTSGDYIDTVDEKTGTIVYTGMGLYGDQTWTAFNERVRDSGDKILLYFKKPKTNTIIFKHRAKYVDHFYANEPDRNNEMRKVIKFRLKIV